MALEIKRGDAYPLEVKCPKLNGNAVDIGDIELVEVYIGDLRKTYPADGTYAGDTFYFPLTQEETFAMPAGEALVVDIRVKFVGETVIGVKRRQVARIIDSTSREVL